MSHEWLMLTRVVRLEYCRASVDRLSSRIDAIGRRIVELESASGTTGTTSDPLRDLCRSALRKEEKRRKKKEFKWAKLVVSLFRMLRDMPISFYVCACGPFARPDVYLLMCMRTSC